MKFQNIIENYKSHSNLKIQKIHYEKNNLKDKFPKFI